MTYEFEYLMHLLSCGASGVAPQPPRQPVNHDRLIQLAHEQSVLPIIGTALANAKNIGFPIEKAQALAAKTRSLALTNYLKKGLVLKLLNDLEEAGIQAVLLKGFALADLYAEPDCRVSSDTDIYIDIKDEKKAYKLLRERGCKVYPRTSHNHHAVCEHPQMGYIELHVSLYNEFIEFIWSSKIDEQLFKTENDELCKTDAFFYHTLGITDNLIYLALHMVKHFINDRTNLRQMMDFALYLQRYQARIDSKRFWFILESLKCRKLINTILSAMVSFCDCAYKSLDGFDKAEEHEIIMLITDLESNGSVNGSEAKRRNNAFRMYSRSICLEKNTLFSYRRQMIKVYVIDCINALFPPLKVMKNQYPYLRKMIWLAPIAWFQYMSTRFRGLFRRIFGAGIAVEQNQDMHERVDRFQLFKLMRML